MLQTKGGAQGDARDAAGHALGHASTEMLLEMAQAIQCNEPNATPKCRAVRWAKPVPLPGTSLGMLLL